nr:NADH dehydrogenase [ubiquinone] 1 beta subcomplex subunit 3-A-like [Malus domestica]
MVKEIGGSKKALGTTWEFFRRRDEWRKHPMLSNQLHHATPGIGIAIVAFGVYLVGEQIYDRLIAPSPSPSSSSSSSSHHAYSHSVSSISATH